MQPGRMGLQGVGESAERTHGVVAHGRLLLCGEARLQRGEDILHARQCLHGAGLRHDAQAEGGVLPAGGVVVGGVP